MTSKINGSIDPLQIARAVKAACVQSAREAYENASTSGLCGEGALEVAIGAIETLDIDSLLKEINNR